MLIILLQFFSFCSKDSVLQANDELVGTKWESKVAEDCTDSLQFKPNQIVREYSCEAGEWYKGSYRLSNDTLVTSYVNDSEGGVKEYWRVRYLYKGNLLKAIGSQSYSKGKWQKEKPLTDARYVYKRVKK